MIMARVSELLGCCMFVVCLVGTVAGVGSILAIGFVVGQHLLSLLSGG